MTDKVLKNPPHPVASGVDGHWRPLLVTYSQLPVVARYLYQLQVLERCEDAQDVKYGMASNEADELWHSMSSAEQDAVEAVVATMHKESTDSFVAGSLSPPGTGGIFGGGKDDDG